MKTISKSCFSNCWQVSKIEVEAGCSLSILSLSHLRLKCPLTMERGRS
jgi:hypothetical protein